MTELPTYDKLHLEDGKEWSDIVLQSMRDAEWIGPSKAFRELVQLLPQVYDALEVCGYAGLAQKLEKSVEHWDKYF